MKKLTTGASALLSLLYLGSIAPVHAGAMYLTCTLDQSRSIEYGEGAIRGGKVVAVPKEGATWGSWKPLEKGPRVLKFTLNEADQSGSLFDETTSKSYKLPLVTFQPESILTKKIGPNLSLAPSTDTYTISRLDGSAVWVADLLPGQYKIEYSGKCAKSQPKETLF